MGAEGGNNNSPSRCAVFRFQVMILHRTEGQFSIISGHQSPLAAEPHIFAKIVVMVFLLFLHFMSDLWFMFPVHLPRKTIPFPRDLPEGGVWDLNHLTTAEAKGKREEGVETTR